MSARNDCVLAVAPVPRGMGVFVIDVSGKPLDWRVKETRVAAKHKNAWCLAQAGKLIDEHGPIELVLEDGRTKRKRTAQLLDLLTEHAIDCGIGVARYGRAEVRQALRLPTNSSKDKVAAEIVKRLPRLTSRQPKVKRSWEPERYAMSIFTAAGLALTHLSRAQGRVLER